MELATAIILACCALGAGIAVGFAAIGPAIGEGYAVCKSCELAGLDYERTSGKVRFKRLVIFKHTVLPFRFYFSQKEI